MENLSSSTTRYIALFVFSRSMKKLFSIDYVNISFLNTFFNRFFPGEQAYGYPTLLISSFINFNISFRSKSAAVIVLVFGDVSLLNSFAMELCTYFSHSPLPHSCERSKLYIKPTPPQQLPNS